MGLFFNRDSKHGVGSFDRTVVRIQTPQKGGNDHVTREEKESSKEETLTGAHLE
jgi:hypothetical protein